VNGDPACRLMDDRYHFLLKTIQTEVKR
jgi:hypothetical protein